MSARRCSNCSAPLPAAAPGEVITCRYCGTEDREPGRIAHRRPPDAVDPPVVAPDVTRNRTVGVYAGVIAAAVGIGAAVLGLVTRSASPAPSLPPAPPPAPPPPTASTPALHKADLSQLDEERRVTVDPSGMAGSFAAFDPVANLAFATKLAQSWAVDARLWQLWVTGVKPDGSIDATGGPDMHPPGAEYFFFSPARRAANVKLAEVSDKLGWSDLRMQVDHGEWRVEVDNPIDASFEPPPAPVPCGIPAAMTEWSHFADGLPKRPALDVDLDFNRGAKQWVWDLRGWGHPPIDPTTCRMKK